jgi:hypothetical protein
MPEFRKIIGTPPTVLRRHDIKRLAELLVADLPRRPKAFDFAVSSGDAQFRADSIEELLEQDLPDQIDSFTVNVRGWTEDNNIDRGISLNLRRTLGDYQIHSLDEVWFRGKIQQLNEFFKARRPWYASMRTFFPGLSGALYVSLFFALVFLLATKAMLLAGISLLALGLSVWSFRSYLRGKMLPHTRILVKDRHSNVDKEFLMLIFTILGALATLAGVIFTVFFALNQRR